MKAAVMARAGTFAKSAATPIKVIPANPQLMQATIAGGAAAFKVNCVQCHGAGTASSGGYRNLNYDDWIWGGTLTEIEYTLSSGDLTLR
jgi:cytochrome c oxidase cbb3-type subunit 3